MPKAKLIGIGAIGRDNRGLHRPVPLMALRSKSHTSRSKWPRDSICRHPIAIASKSSSI